MSNQYPILPLMGLQPYNRYQRTSFDNSLTDLQKLNRIASYLNDVITQLNGLTTLENEHSTHLNGIDQSISDLWDELQNLIATDKEDVIQKSANLYSTFEKKIRDKQAIKIVVRGDSTVYGSDFASLDVRPPTGTADDGTAHVANKASTTFPEALSTYLNSVNGGNVTVINQGYSGDGTKKGYTHWNPVVGADVTIMSYGINDAGNSAIEYMGDVAEFLKWYRLMIERELNNGTAVILMTPQKQRIVATSDDGYRTDIDVFSGAVKMLAKEYNLPLIDGQTIFKNYPADLYSDYTHLNGRGYTVMGGRIAAALLGKGVSHPFEVDGQSFQGVISFTDGTVYQGGFWANNEYYPTSEENETGMGTGAVLAAGEKLHFPFYAKSDNMIAVPSMFSSNANMRVKVSLDFDNVNADYSNSYDFGRKALSNTDLPKPPSSFVLSQPNFNAGSGIHSGAYIEAMSDIGLIVIPYKGFHMITVEVISDSTGGTITVHGMQYYDAGRLSGARNTKEQLLDLQNGITNYYTGDPTSIFIDQNGRVDITGVLNNIPSTPRPLLIATVPTDFAPKANKAFNVSLSSSTGGGYANISVQTNGEIYLNYMSTPVAYCQLNGITYRTR
jgi:lysophospholipase L1-like esterase